MKYLALTLTTVIFTFLGGVLVAGATSHGGYIPLAPLPGTLDPKIGEVTLTSYLSGMIKLLIAVAGSLAFVMMVIGGTQYVAGGISPSAQKTARDRITNAIIGLVLTLVSYLILLSINPKLVEFNLTLPPIVPKEAPLENLVSTGTFEGNSWNDDSVARKELADANVEVQRTKSCAFIGDTSCTSLAGLGSSAIEGLKKLSAGCNASAGGLVSTNAGPCKVVVTGGTEYWLHGNRSTDRGTNPTKHGVGNSVVDLSIQNAALNSYIRKFPADIDFGCAVGPHYRIGSAIYVDERIKGNPPHWHVCY